MTKRELKRQVAEFNRLSDRAVELFEIYVDNPSTVNDVVFWNAMELVKKTCARLFEMEPQKLHLAEYLHNYGGRQMTVTRLEVW